MAPPRGTDNGVEELRVVDKPRIRPSLVTFGSLVSGGLTKRMEKIYRNRGFPRKQEQSASMLKS